MIRTHALTKRDNHGEGLSNVELHVARGECLGLAGADSAARSILLRVLATLIRPSSGRAEIDGIDVAQRVYEVRTRLAYVGRDVTRGHGLCVREYLDFLRVARPRTAGRALMRMGDVLERADLAPDAAVDELSLGLRQCLAMAGALMVNPLVLLLDDPLRAMAPAARGRFVEWLSESSTAGTTIVIALGDDDAMNVPCHSIARFSGGQLVSRASLPDSVQLPGSLHALPSGER